MISRKNFSQKQIHPSTPKTTDVKKRKYETQHQNGSTIGRKKTNADEQEITNGKQQKKAGAVTKRKMETTDELEQTFELKQKSTPKAKVANLIQKQPKTEEKHKPKPAAMEQQPNNGINPLDTILDEIEAFDTANKRNKKAESEDDELDNAPCSSRQLPPTPMPGSYRSLNRMELARQDQDQSMVQSFLQRDDLMQQILAYKMLKGRVESYATIKLKIDLDKCMLPEYERSPNDKNDLRCDTVSLDIKDVPTEMKLERNNSLSETLEQAGLKRGPMTPPGSPGTNRSSTPEADVKHAKNTVPGQNDLPMKLSTLKKDTEDPAEEESTTKEMLGNFCSTTGIPMEMIQTFLGDELHKLDKLKMEDLMTNFLSSLSKVATEKIREVGKECLSSNALRSPALSMALPKDENKSMGSEGFPKAQAEQRVDDNFEMDAMEISSQSAVSSGTLSFSNGLLPPPPAPPPLLDGTESVFIVPPPPPPPPLHEENVSFLLPSSSQHLFTASLPSQIMVKDSPQNGEQSSPPFGSYDYETNSSEPIDHHSTAAIPQITRYSKRPKIYEGRGNKKGKSIPLRFPKLLKTMSRKGNNRGCIERSCQTMKTTNPTTNNTRPVPLLSLNLVEPFPEAVCPKKSDGLMDNKVGTSIPMQQQPNGRTMKVIDINSKQSREAPIMVDLEFIKNTPPPPIPDIIKRRISNDNRVSMVGISSTPQVPIGSQSLKLPPQPLLRMDLPRPPIFHLHRPPLIYRQPKIDVRLLPPRISTPNASAILQTVVQAIGGSPLAFAHKTPIFQRHPLPPPNADVSPYGKFF